MRMRKVMLSTDNQAEEKNLTNMQTGMFSKKSEHTCFFIHIHPLS